ncbi:cytochrome c [Bordetella bronchialis]|uniref:Cytochrome C n=1 Tax=Bordetella bronchialis TaxID=463025 RepID=A0A193G1M9_9BORD|nr:c-type cytochrome [Bordetella bronchialis]ANN68224.1 cytochrome C [Bordetella bronchialis]ANN73356.1 cytochrome C [Bordetella bronchialis]
MKGRYIAAGVLAIVVLGGVAACSIAYRNAIDPIQPPAAASFDGGSIARGAQLAAVGDCISCHTSAGGKPYAGGTPLDTPFGTLYSTNITPDPDTGIGKWSLAAFTRAMREGVSRDGHLLYPAFPYAHFTRMSDADIKDLYAYMMTRTPVKAPARENQLAFPLGYRPLIAGWNLLYLHPGALPDDASHSAEWLRGRYLVEGPGHCAACHTPMTTLGGEDGAQPFAGGSIDGWDVPPLNALGHKQPAWTVDQLTAYLRTGLASQHGAAAGPMEPVTRQLALVSESDVRAMAVYLLSLDSQPAAAAPAPRPEAQAQPADAGDAQRLERGAALFSSTCASCHAASAPMAAIGGRPSLAASSVVNADTPRNAINLVLQGIPLRGSAASHYMPSFAHSLNDQQIADILAYTRVRIAQRPAWSGLEDSVAKIRKENTSQ